MAYFAGSGYYAYARGFTAVTAQAASGTTDSAYLYDGSGSNTFAATPGAASFTGTGLSETANEFAKVYAYAASGTTDNATLSDASGSNTFEATPSLAYFTGTGFYAYAKGFTAVTGQAASGIDRYGRPQRRVGEQHLHGDSDDRRFHRNRTVAGGQRVCERLRLRGERHDRFSHAFGRFGEQ